MELELARGVRDVPPEEKIIKERVLTVLKKIFEKYGYNPLETPIIERLDTLTSKFAAGEESDAYKEIFKLKDQGNRDLGLRFELTLSLCRYIAMNPNIKLPFKRYEMGKVYRDGPIKLGRYREFWQCDIDIAGTSSMLADAEVLAIVKDVFKELKLDIEIGVNNRKLLNGILEVAGVKENLLVPTMISIDKLKKIGIKLVEKELIEIGVSKESILKINKILSVKGNNEEKLERLNQLVNNEFGREGISELKELLKYLKEMGVKVLFNPSLSRGLGYYTGPVYEAFLKKSEIKSSVVGGGRYDKFIGEFLGNGKQIPITGLSFGLEPITDALRLSRSGKTRSVTQIYIIPIKAAKECLKLIKKLRAGGINSDMDLVGRGLSKNLDYVNSYGIPYALIIGEKEIKSKKYTLRDMKTGKESRLDIEKIIKKFSLL